MTAVTQVRAWSKANHPAAHAEFHHPPSSDERWYVSLRRSAPTIFAHDTNAYASLEEACSEAVRVLKELGESIPESSS